MNLDLCGLDEALNPMGPNRCTSNAWCEGARTCSPWGWCEGTTYCAPIKAGTDDIWNGEKEAFGINNTGTINVTLSNVKYR